MDDIIYVKVVKRNIIFKTENGYFEGSLTNQLEEILSRFGYVRLNPNVIAQISKIKSIDKKLRLAYFDDAKEYFIQISRINLRQVSTMFDNQ